LCGAGGKDFLEQSFRISHRIVKVLFLHSTTEAGSLRKPLQSLEQTQFGVSYSSSLLKQHGHETELLVLRACPRVGDALWEWLIGKKNRGKSEGFVAYAPNKHVIFFFVVRFVNLEERTCSIRK
jgi:hypothetical protein